MNGKEKFIFAILIALVGGAFYFQIMTDELNLRMDELDLADKSHVDKVLNEFSDSLRVYNLRFNGRGKHLRTAQKDILSNADLIEKNTDSLATMIDDVGFKLDNFKLIPMFESSKKSSITYFLFCQLRSWVSLPLGNNGTTL